MEGAGAEAGNSLRSECNIRKAIRVCEEIRVKVSIESGTDRCADGQDMVCDRKNKDDSR